MVFLLVIHVLIAGALVAAFFGGRSAVLKVAGFTVPLSGLVLAGDVGWSWIKVLPAVLVAGALLLPGGRPLKDLPARGTLLALLGWATLVTGWFRVMDLELGQLLEVGRQYGWGPAQCEYRHAVQLVVEVGNWAIFVAAFRLSAGPSEARAGADGFVLGNVVSVLVGGYQALAHGLGLPWLDREDGEILNGNLGLGDVQGTALTLGSLKVARLYGLGGEPKHTAALAVMAIGLLLARDLDGRRGRFDRPALALLITGLALTVSTSGWVALVVLCALLTVSAFRQGAEAAGHRLLRLGLNLGILGVVVVTLGGLLGDYERDGILDKKVVDRLSSLERVAHYEPKDAAAIAVFGDRPYRLVTGSGVGGADFYSLEYNTRIDIGPRAMITPTYFIIRTVAELGLVGLCLILRVLWKLGRSAHGVNGGLLTALGAITLMQPMLTLPAFLFLAGTQLGAGLRAPVSIPARDGERPVGARSRPKLVLGSVRS